VEFSDFSTTAPSQFYRPIFWLSLWSDYTIWGPDPAGFHATNIVLHALNGILIFSLMRRWFGNAIGVITAMTWLSLPIHSEVVAWISGRGLSLATTFILITLIHALKYAEDERSIRLWVMGIASFGAMLSHEGGIVAPALALFSFSTRKRNAGPVLVAVGVPAAVYVLVRVLFLNLNPPIPSGFREILLRTPVSLAKYVWWTVHAPAMSVERSTELVTLQFKSAIYANAWLTLVVAGLLAVFSSVPLLSCALLGTLIALLPFSQILPLYQSMAERYAYAASIGILVAIVALLCALQVRLRLPWWIPAGVLSIWMVSSISPLEHRIHAWSDERTLYTTSLQASPGSYVLNHNLGVLEEEAGRTESAFSLYRKAIQLKPDYFIGRKDLANFYLRTHNLPEAQRAYTEFLRDYPNNREVQLNLASVLLAQGDSDSAIRLLRMLVTNDPGFVEAQVDLGVALLGNNNAEARSHLEEALRLKPDSAEAAYNLGILEENAGHLDEARRLYRQTLFYRPGHQKAAERLRALR
jgi:Flp pilus assembly protein TadD